MMECNFMLSDGRGKKVQMRFETEIKLRHRMTNVTKKMTTRDSILKFVIFLSLVVIFLSRLSFCFVSQFYFCLNFVLSCPVV